MTLCVTRWIFLLSLAVGVLVSVSQVESYVPIVGLSCCRNVSSRRIERVKQCYEQKPREGCNQHAFLIVTRRGKRWCINSTSKWLKEKMEKNNLQCPSDLSLMNLGR